MTNIYYKQKLLNLIKYPIITDKTTKAIEDNTYYFAVDKKINKQEIKQAIEYIFDVKVKKVNTLNKPIKIKKLGKFKGRIVQHKKAIIKLDSESSINIFENS
uniref:Large ribosomal subunit protein uL23c n=1 Tax=Dipterocladia arabiensis TaxID=2007176 RepID=A0A1Z1M0Y6_9FLOR|nr:ribosomal protein L23 [Dipterocladia arabiensis]ARW59423.1 ribosomal protein L23 [Dipterocladia arabiensis]